MSNLQKFNLIYVTGLWTIGLSGITCIYLFPSKGNMIFWFTVFMLWIYSYRPIVNKFFYTKMMNELAVKLSKLDTALKLMEEREKKAQSGESKE